MPDTKIVTTPDGVEHEFPVAATDAQISAILKMPPKASRGAPSRSWTDMAVDALPAIGGAAGGILGGLTGIPTLGLTSAPAAIAGATALGAGGEAAKQLINRARGKDAPTSATDAALGIGKEGAIQGALEGTGQAVTAGLVKGGTAIYRGILKPSLSKINAPKAAQIVQTAIQEALPVSEAGATQAQATITALRSEADRILQQSSGEVDLHSVADRLRSWASQMYNRPGRAPIDLEAAMKVADRIDNHPSMIPTPPMAPADRVSATAANQVKRDMQAGASSAFGVKSGAEKSAEKQGSRFLREGIEAVAPEVGPINARESKLIDAARALHQATAREGNKSQIYGVQNLIAGAVGGEEYARTRNPFSATAMTLALKAGMHPAVASRVAILAVKLGQKMPGQLPANIARAAYQAISESQQQADGVPDHPQE